MIQLTVDTKLYLFENDQMEKVMEISRQVLRHGIPVQIIPDERAKPEGDNFSGENLSGLLSCFVRRGRVNDT